MMTPAQQDVYDCLKKSGEPQSLQKLASTSGRSHNRTRQLVERLIKDGLVERLVIRTGRTRNEYRALSKRGANERRVTDSDVLAAVTKMLRARSRRMGDAIDVRHLQGGKHLDDGTPERTYWHAGYVRAMCDALRMIERREKEYPGR